MAGIEQFCDVETMAFEEALSRLKLLLTATEWKARHKSSVKKCYNCDIRGHFARDYRKPKKEKTMLVSDDEEAMLV
ncbi:hypothetical protein GUJ93_ZPchr0014g47236 [Zizania palustris]|uniref:CCHC-type domain-containing protein n=1 Tax=Zizania palustris TaxID=103762 RepID=A0A8J5W087_ZIZPA|nr:hypothetical protein GUJ93_ZPchr0014g47236 [Zizania palustris]